MLQTDYFTKDGSTVVQILQNTWGIWKLMGWSECWESEVTGPDSGWADQRLRKVASWIILTRRLTNICKKSAHYQWNWAFVEFRKSVLSDSLI